ncbi:MAG: DUF2905 domain-containing protein [Bacteroidia bacterium]
MGKLLIISGIILIIVGILFLMLQGKTGWFGNLPGDIKVEKPNFTFYFPVVTMVLLSIIISLIFYFFAKFFK